MRRVVYGFYLNSQYQTDNKPNYMEANKRMLRMRHWGGYYFKWKILIPGGATNRYFQYNENLKRPWYCRSNFTMLEAATCRRKNNKKDVLSHVLDKQS